MFSVYHLIWLAICAALIAICLYITGKKKTPFSSVLDAAALISILSECIKVFSVIRIVPLSDGTGTIPYLELNHLPLHLCSIQILFILYVRSAAEDSPARRRLLGFMFPSCILGAAAALLMPSIYTSTIRPDQSFTHLMAYQFFLFHSMLIILGVSIYRRYKDDFSSKDYRNGVVIIVALAVIAIYLNSVFSVPLYENGEVVSIENYTNFFFTYNPPIPVKLTQVWHWMLYLVILTGVAVGLLTLIYIPVFRNERRRAAFGKQN